MKNFIVFLGVFVCLAVNALAADSATVLARILAGKGAITAEELAKVESASSDRRVDVLAALLEQKGLLSGKELALVRGDGDSMTVARFEPAVYTPPMVTPTVVAPPAQPRTEAPAATATTPPVTAQSKFPVTIYGTILFNSFFDTAVTNIQDVPLFAAKQNSDPLGNDKSFGMTARQTRFGMRYQGPQIGGARLSGQLELDLFGGKAALGNGINMDIPRLRLALGRLDWSHVALVGGQDWSIFAPLNPTSLAEFAIPEMSASGNPWIRTPQLRAEFHNASTAPTRVLLQVAAVDPNMGDYSTAAFATVRTPGIGERGRAPGIESRLAVTTKVDDRDFSFGVSTHWAHGKNAGLIGATAVQIPLDSWGVAADYTLPFTKFFNLTGEIYEGRALGIFSVASGEAILPIGSAVGTAGVLSRGGWSQLQVNFTPKWQMNLAYGIDQPRSSDLRVGDRVRNQTYMTNLMYKYTPHITFAWEWRRFLTDFKAQRTANERGDHANLGIAYIF
jgi:hypothetical protein